MFAVNILILAAGLVLILIKWKELPAEIGMHFDSDGNFDVIASKFYGFYPQIVGGIIIAGIAAADHFIQRKNTGLKISEKGEKLFKSELLLNLDFLLLIPCIFLSHWSYCVAEQTSLNLELMKRILAPISIIVSIGILIQIVTCFIYRQKKEDTADSGLTHRLSRLIPWLLTAGGIASIAECWNRYPINTDLYYDPQYFNLAYFSNFDAYMDKHLLLIPHAVVIILLTISEIVSVKAGKKNNVLLVSMTDKLKLIFGAFFFWWNLVLEEEQSIGVVSAGLFILLCMAAIVTHAFKKKKAGTAPQN